MFEAMFKGWLRAYEWTLDRVIKYKAVVLLITIATLFGTVYLYVIIPKGFFPSEDTGFISGSTEAAADVSLSAISGLQSRVADIIRKDPAVDYVNSTVGPGGPSPATNTGRMFIALKPRAERGESAIDVIQRLRRSANTVPGMDVTFQAVQNINLTGRASKAEFQYTLTSSDSETLYRI